MATVELGNNRILSIRTKDAVDGAILATVYELDADGVDSVVTLTVPLPDETELETRHMLAYTGGHMYAAEKAADYVGFDGELRGAYHGSGAFVFVAA